MKKIICIGECALDIVFENGVPVGSMPGGRIINAAAIMSRENLPVKVVSEASRDSVGDMIVSHLSAAGTDVSGIDRFTEGHTPVLIYTRDDKGLTSVTRYEDYPDECFDVVWPRIDEGDIVIYGGYYALDSRMRQRMMPLLTHASERKAILVYLPGFLPQQQTRITRVMPAMFENLEIATLILTRNQDLKIIFGTENAEDSFRNHINFYCRSLINVNATGQRICYFGGTEVTEAEIPASLCQSLMWNAGAVAGVAGALLAHPEFTPEVLNAPDEQIRRTLLEAAVKTAAEAARELTHSWQQAH